MGFFFWLEPYSSLSFGEDSPLPIVIILSVANFSTGSLFDLRKSFSTFSVLTHTYFSLPVYSRT